MEEAGYVHLAALLHAAALVALRVLDGGLGLGRGVHVLGDDRAREARPEPARLVRLLLVLGRDPLWRDLLPVLVRVEEDAFLALWNGTGG